MPTEPLGGNSTWAPGYKAVPQATVATTAETQPLTDDAALQPMNKILITAHAANPGTVALCNTPTPNLTTGAGVLKELTAGAEFVIGQETRGNILRAQSFYLASTGAGNKVLPMGVVS